MAPDEAPTSAATPAFSVNSSDSTGVARSEPPTFEPSSFKSLKRSRPEFAQNPSNLTSIANASLSASPSPKSPRFTGAFSPKFSPAPLTGAAALEDERKRKEEQQKSSGSAMSENPSHKALSSLIAGGGLGMSKSSDAPVATTAMSGAMATVANAISIPSPMNTDEKSETSPASVTSLTSLGNTSAQTATASTTASVSPATVIGPSEGNSRDPHFGVSADSVIMGNEKQSNRAFTFPGNVLSNPETSRAGARGMSLPMSGINQQLAPRSPSHKKHKCPYCETEFTRHHNLKSHLLTHSQEKPYVCQTCQMRFRRLHDLKRHTKLHTGERPHICPKCDRKFARGDALARHSKGQGGCAGRRASMGSFGGDDDYDGEHGEGDDSMDGVIYAEPGEHTNEGDLSEEDHRRFSLPSIKAQHVGPNHGVQESYTTHARTPSTYPPAGPRQRQPSSGGLYPPNVEHGGSMSSGTSPSMQNSVGHSPNTSISTAQSAGGPSMFSQAGMTESPKPLSPGAMNSHQLGGDSNLNRQRSPSLTTQFQQQHFGRRPSDRSSPQGMSLPSPYSSKLPAISGLAPPESRFTLPSQVSSQQQSPTNGAQGGQPVQTAHSSGNTLFQPPMAGSGPGRSGQPGNGPPGHHQGSGSGDSGNNLFASGDRGVWTYIQSLEEKVKLLSERVAMMENFERGQEEKIARLAAEVDSLRNHLGPAQPQNAPGFSHLQQ